MLAINLIYSSYYIFFLVENQIWYKSSRAFSITKGRSTSGMVGWKPLKIYFSMKASGLAETVILYFFWTLAKKHAAIWRVFIQENNWILERTVNFLSFILVYINIKEVLWAELRVKSARWWHRKPQNFLPNKHTNSSAVHRQSCFMKNSETNWKAPAPGRTQN